MNSAANKVLQRHKRRKTNRIENKHGTVNRKKSNGFSNVRQVTRCRGDQFGYFNIKGHKVDGAEAKQQFAIEKQKEVQREQRRLENARKGDIVVDLNNAQFNSDNPILKALPDHIIKVYNITGINFLYKWQLECLNSRGVLFKSNPNNLVYTAPTSGGKSLVAELLMLNRLETSRQKKALMVLPYVSLSLERAKDLQDKWLPGGYCVMPLTSQSKVRNVDFGDDIDVGICTIEKANLIINKLFIERRLHELCAVVIDEVHLLREKKRGLILEILIVKLKLISAKYDIQIICMSATLPNANRLASWLNAEYYEAMERPIPLKEIIKVKNKLYDINNLDEPIKSIDWPEDKKRLLSKIKKKLQDEKQISLLCMHHTSVLVFCPTRSNCELVTKQIACHFEKLGYNNTTDKAIYEARKKLINDLKFSPDGIDMSLEYSITFGVAFHHAGMISEQRVLIEEAFRKNLLNILVATSTVAAGVNLPAELVIFESPKIATMDLDPFRYKQMSGRAGRTGKSERGCSILICDKKEVEKVKKLSKPLENLRSQFSNNNNEDSKCLNIYAMKRLILEVIVTGLATNLNDFLNIISQSFMSELSKDDIIAANNEDSNNAMMVNKDSNNTMMVNKDSDNAMMVNKDSNNTMMVNEDSNNTMMVNKDSNNTMLVNKDSNNTMMVNKDSDNTMMVNEDSNNTMMVNEDSNNTMMVDKDSNNTMMVNKDSNNNENSNNNEDGNNEANNNSSNNTNDNNVEVMYTKEERIKLEIIEIIGQLVKDDLVIVRSISHNNVSDLKQIVESKHEFNATTKAEGICASGLHPDEALQLFDIIVKVNSKFILAEDLQSCYVIAPVNGASISITRNFERRCRFSDQLSNAEGVLEKAIKCLEYDKNRLASEFRCGNIEKLKRFQRLYQAFILRDIVSEMSFTDIATKYDITVSSIQNLQAAAAVQAGMVQVFCENMIYTRLALIISLLGERLASGCRAELIDLCKIQDMKPYRARMFYEHNFTKVEDIARAPYEIIFTILQKNMKTKFNAKLNEQQQQHDKYLHSLARKIKNSAQEILNLK